MFTEVLKYMLFFIILSVYLTRISCELPDVILSFPSVDLQEEKLGVCICRLDSCQT
jgi:hypothetical protein